jgi:hypothetical protein
MIQRGTFDTTKIPSKFQKYIELHYLPSYYLLDTNSIKGYKSDGTILFN